MHLSVAGGKAKGKSKGRGVNTRCPLSKRVGHVVRFSESRVAPESLGNKSHAAASAAHDLLCLNRVRAAPWKGVAQTRFTHNKSC